MNGSAPPLNKYKRKRQDQSGQVQCGMLKANISGSGRHRSQIGQAGSEDLTISGRAISNPERGR